MQKKPTKSCPSCQNTYPRNEYGNSRVCKRCHRDSELRRKYNITLEAWEQMLAEQDDACAICGTQRQYTRLVTDGDTDRKIVYGIVCLRCLACISAERAYKINAALQALTNTYLDSLENG